MKLFATTCLLTGTVLLGLGPNAAAFIFLTLGVVATVAVLTHPKNYE